MGAPKGNKFALGNKGGKGGPAKYHINYAKLAALAVAAGHTEIEVANLLCISTGTLWNWKIKHKEFAEAVKTGRVQINERVVHRRVGIVFTLKRDFRIAPHGRRVELPGG